MKNRKIAIWVMIIILGITLTAVLAPKIQNHYLENAISSSSKTQTSYDITVSGTKWTNDGKVLTTIYLGPNTVWAISTANNLAAVAKYAAKAIDIGQAAQSLSKSYKTGSKTLDAVKDLLNYDELIKLNPQAVAQMILGWATDYLSDSVMQNCMVTATKDAIYNKMKDKNGGVTLYLTTNFFTEKSSWYDGWYLYKQRAWGTTQTAKSCTETKECIQFLYSDGKNGNCGWFQ